jgi:histone acetyltransferase
MPPDYVTRIVFDTRHFTLLGLLNQEPVAALVFRPFPAQPKQPEALVELVFCIVTTPQQGMGLGGRLMAHFKARLQHWPGLGDGRRDQPVLVLVYADLGALGYFQRQGFRPMEEGPARALWDVGVVKHYEGAQLMFATVEPRIDYLHWARLVFRQREALQAKLQTLTHMHEVHTSPHTAGQLTTPHLNLAHVPELRACGWDPAAWQMAMSPEAQAAVRRANEALLAQLEADNHLAAPFARPVVEIYPAMARRYLAVIKDPMDLRTLRERLDAGVYVTTDMFKADALRMLDNAIVYNPADSFVADCARCLKNMVGGAPVLLTPFV